MNKEKSVNVDNSDFNMGILALKIAGKKNGVSKLHGEVSRELFAEVWPNIAANESPITHITNGIHPCSWLAPNLKKLYNKYGLPLSMTELEMAKQLGYDRIWDCGLFKYVWKKREE